MPQTFPDSTAFHPGYLLPKKDVKNIWRTISEDYFLRYSADESAWHTIAISACNPEDLPLTLLRPQSQHGTAEVFLYTKNRDFIFSTSTGVLDRLGLTILNARIITTHNGYVLNSYQINDRPLVSEGIKEKLKKAVIEMVGTTAHLLP